MFARINSLGVYALNGFSVSVEADISGGWPQFTIVGLPDSAVRVSPPRAQRAEKPVLRLARQPDHRQF